MQVFGMISMYLDCFKSHFSALSCQEQHGQACWATATDNKTAAA